MGFKVPLQPKPFYDFMSPAQLHSRPESVKANGYSNKQEKGHTPFGVRVGHPFLKTGLKSPPQHKPLERHWRLSLTMIWTTSFS